MPTSHIVSGAWFVQLSSNASQASDVVYVSRGGWFREAFVPHRHSAHAADFVRVQDLSHSSPFRGERSFRDSPGVGLRRVARAVIEPACHLAAGASVDRARDLARERFQFGADGPEWGQTAGQ